ncbi:MAG TPA: DUF998 domain-containing protein [Candidatus Bathyarchaeia archaeon]|nr:DUF998 domain-containing protein [Candidatus Bathyarchaeia archaeon]
MPKFKNALRLRISGICGFLAPVFAFALIFSAIASYSQFSWVDNALSDLGVVAGVTAVLFNSGLLIGGALCFIFATGLSVFLKERTVGRIGAFVLVLTSLALFAIGVFPENVRPAHYFVSVMFFVLLPISMLIIAGTFWLTRQVRMAVFTLLVAVAAAAPWVLYFSIHYVSGVAVPEAVSAFAGSVWAVVLSGKMLRQASHSKIP